MHRRLVLALLLSASPVRADVNPATTASAAPPITLPADGDDYSHLVAQAATRDKNLDFHALRYAWLTSAARQRRNERSLGDERRQLVEAVKNNDPAQVRDKATALLSLEYVDMNAQKLLRQSCTLLHDQDCADQAHFVEFGMLNSIVHSGDGKTCPTGWDVAMIGEEYFVLAMLGTKFQQQALVKGEEGHSCDAMTVMDDKAQQRIYYFRIDRVLADEAASLKLKP